MPAFTITKTYEPSYLSPWLTTIDVARALRMTAKGVRWLVGRRKLAAERTRCGQYLFRRDDVEQLAAERTATALATVRPQMLRARARTGPRQLLLFGAQVRSFRPRVSTSRSGSASTRDRSGIQKAAR